MNLADKFLPVATKLLTRFGTAATLTRTGVTGPVSAAAKFDREARQAAVASPVVIQTLAIIGDEKQIDITTGATTYTTMATMLAQPIQGDTLTLGNQSYRVGQVTTIAPQGVAIYYKCAVS